MARAKRKRKRAPSFSGYPQGQQPNGLDVPILARWAKVEGAWRIAVKPGWDAQPGWWATVRRRDGSKAQHRLGAYVCIIGTGRNTFACFEPGERFSKKKAVDRRAVTRLW